MAYGIKYIMQFTSDRGNEIRIEVLKKDYQGEIIYKSLGGAPSLSIEQGDGAIKGSSLAFAMQADVEGELQELYTTDNKLFKVNLYKNDTLRWQGYMLPELYSENYVDAPYDVSVTATDGLATLKAVTYIGNDVNASIANIISNIVARTEISMPIVYHMQLAHNFKKNIGEDIELSPGIGLPIPMLTDTYINQAAYNGYSCYDVLNQILQSCNCNIMQINGEWLVSSNTDYSESYYVAEDFTVRSHKVIGQMGIADVYPLGTLSMVNVPALKGVTVEYSHMLRNSFLQNANCESRKGWNYTPDSRIPIDIPGEREMFGKIFKAYCWELHPNNIQENNSLQLWQDVQLSQDAGNVYTLSVKTLFSTNAKLFLLSVTHIGNDGVDRQLTGEGWVTQWNKSDVNSYIQITGQAKGAGFETICNIKEYDVTSVQFYLPDVGGSLRIGFINSTLDYANPFAYAPIYVTQVYLSVGNVTGQQAVTLVEPNATQEQQNVLIVYGDTFESQNAHKIETNTLKNFAGENIGTWWLNGISYTSYYNMMLQEYSRYFGVKKMQLQGVLMGDNVLHNIYQDTHSGKPLRLLTAHVDLLTEEASVTLEEIVNKNVDYEATIEAAFNNNQFGQTSGSGNNSSGGGSGTPGGGDPGYAEITAQSIVDALGYVPYDSRNPSKYITESALNSYATNDDIASVNLSIEKLSRAVENRVLASEFDVFKGTVNPLFGYFDAAGNANNALKLGGHSADYFATAKAVNTLTTDLNSLASRVSINEQGIATNKTNIATLTTDLGKLTGRVDKLEGYWYIDDDGNLHTTHNIVVDGGGAFGKGSGGGGDVPSASVSIKFEGSDVLYNPTNGVITLPAYPSAGGGVADSVAWSNITGKPNFATVATSGKYSDLSGTPTIPTSLKSPYALTFGSKTYDGSAAKTITASDLGALTAHQSIYALTINNSAGTAQVTYTPNSKAASLTLTKAMVGLSNVENTALSTWVGSAKITTLGTITSGTWNGTKIANSYLANSSMTIAGTSVSLGGSITAATLKTNLGLGSLAYKSSLVASDIPSLDWSKITSGKPTTLAGYGVTDALSTSGGTIFSNSYVPLVLDTTSAQCRIQFRINATDKALVGWHDVYGSWLYNYPSNSFIGVKDDGTPHYNGNTLIHSGNYSSYALPLSGGTMTGTIILPNNNYIDSQDGATILGIDASKGCLVGVTQHPLLLRSNGTATINGNTLIHSENIGSQSVNYASSAGNAEKVGGVPVTSGDNKPWGTIPAITPDGYMDVGRHFEFHYDNTTGSDYSTLLSCTGNYGNFVYLPSTSGTLALLTDNVASATKLQTARTIWGQSFDGTKDVSGDIHLGNYSDFEIGTGYSYDNTGRYNKIVFGGGATGLQYYSGGWTSGNVASHKFIVGNTNTTAVTIMNSGNVLIGATSNNGEKLQVNGNLTVTGGGAFGSDIRYKDITSYRQLNLETIANAPLFTFKWTDRDDKVEHLGTSAQYWLGTQFKDTVNITNPKFFHLDYGALAVGIGISVAREVKGVKTEVQTLKEELSQVKKELKYYKELWQHSAQA